MPPPLGLFSYHPCLGGKAPSQLHEFAYTFSKRWVDYLI